MNINKIKAIAENGHRCQLIVAAAGSGKTQTLVDVVVHRFVHGLISTGKRKLVIFTFTNNAADELSVRLRQLLANAGITDVFDNVFVGTIHGWCRQYLEKQKRAGNYKIMEEHEQFNMINRIYDMLELDRVYKKNRFYNIKKFIVDLEIFYNEGINLNSKNIPTAIRLPLTKYLRFIETENIIDFGMMVRKATEVMNSCKDGEALEVYVDEYQDINPSQVKLLKSMIQAPGSKMIAVGDPRQAIYQWRGSDFERMLKFKEDFVDVETHNLSINRRSRSGIIKFANNVADHMKMTNGGKLPHMEIGPRDDKCISVVNDTTEYKPYRVVNLLLALKEEGCEYSDMAVLFRSVKNDAGELMAALKNNNVPFYSPNKNEGTQFVTDFMGSIIKLMEIAEWSNPQNYDEESEESEKIDDALARLATYCKNVNKHQIHLAVLEWRNQLKAGHNNNNYNFRKQLFEFCSAVQFFIHPHENMLQDGLATTTRIMKALEEVYRRRLVSFKSRPSPLSVFVTNLKWNLESKLDEWANSGMSIKKRYGVVVSTVHAAKGLEWPIVIIPRVRNGVFPVRASSVRSSFTNLITKRYGTSLEDEKRLWYVAITRARDRLYIFSGKDGAHKPSNLLSEGMAPKDAQCVNLSIGNAIKMELSQVVTKDKSQYGTISVSDFLLLLECQYHFYLRKMCGVEVPVGEELGAGDILHRIIERLTVDHDYTNVDQIVNEETFLPLADKLREDLLKKSITEKVKKARANNVFDGIKHAEYGFSLDYGRVMVNGTVDAIRESGQGLEIIDWKSSVDEKFLNRYKLQMLMYTAGLQNLNKRVLGANIIDLGAKNSPDKINATATNNKINKIKRLGLSALNDVVYNIPVTKPSTATCTICDVSSICPDRTTGGDKHE